MLFFHNRHDFLLSLWPLTRPGQQERKRLINCNIMTDRVKRDGARVEGVEFATVPNQNTDNRQSPKIQSLERFCRDELTKRYKITETRSGEKPSISVYNKSGKLLGEYDSLIAAHRALC